MRGLGVPSLWLDEILNVDIARGVGDLPWYSWIIGFERENGPLYFAMQALALSAGGAIELAFRLPSALIGSATVAALAFVAFRLTGSAFAAAAAGLLLCAAPFHVFYSREARPYALLVLLSVVMLAALLGREGRPRVGLLAVAAFLAAATAATSAPLIAGALAVMLLDAAVRPASRRDALGCVALCAAALAGVALLYGRFPQPPVAAGFDGDWGRTAVTLLNSYAVTAFEMETVHPLSIGAVLLAVAGFLSIRDRRGAWLALGLATIPAAASLSALVLLDHWYSPRYTIHSIAPFLLLVGAGVAAVGRIVSDAFFRRAAANRSLLKAALAGAISVALVAPFVVVGSEAAMREPFRRADWKRIATILAAHADDGDIVVTTSEWSAVSVRFYLREAGKQLDVRSVNGSLELARYVIERRPRGWILAGGFARDAEVRNWACRFFTVARDPVEDVRLWFAPNLTAFVRDRATPAERERFARSFTEARGGLLELGAIDGPLLGDGWYGPETAGDEVFRWVKKECAVFLPMPAGNSRLRFRASPIHLIGPRLPFELIVDDRVVAAGALEAGIREYDIDLGSYDTPRLARIEFHFERDIAPADVGASGDVRRLAASFEWIELTGGGPAPDAKLLALAPLLPVLLQVDGEALSEESGPEAACVGTLGLRAGRLEPLLLRLGRADTTNATLQDRARFADAVLSALPPKECLPNEEFVDALFPVLLKRPPDRVGRAYYLASLTAGASRRKIVCRMTEGAEFRKLYE